MALTARMPPVGVGFGEGPRVLAHRGSAGGASGDRAIAAGVQTRIRSIDMASAYSFAGVRRGYSLSLNG